MKYHCVKELALIYTWYKYIYICGHTGAIIVAHATYMKFGGGGGKVGPLAELGHF